MVEKISVGVCDDNQYWREQIAGVAVGYQTEKGIDVFVKQYNSAEQYIEAHDDIDILFLDIQMNGMSGIELKNVLIRNKRKEMIIFVTCYDEYVREAFGKNVCGFIDKPVSKEKVFLILDKIVEEKKQNEKCQLVEGINIPLKEILYIKSNDKYIEIYTEDGIIPGYISLKECEKILPSKLFIRISRFYIVSYAAIRKMASTIEMSDGKMIRVGRGKLKELKNSYFDYVRDVIFSDF